MGRAQAGLLLQAHGPTACSATVCPPAATLHLQQPGLAVLFGHHPLVIDLVLPACRHLYVQQGGTLSAQQQRARELGSARRHRRGYRRRRGRVPHRLLAWSFLPAKPSVCTTFLWTRSLESASSAGPRAAPAAALLGAASGQGSSGSTQASSTFTATGRPPGKVPRYTLPCAEMEGQGARRARGSAGAQGVPLVRPGSARPALLTAAAQHGAQREAAQRLGGVQVVGVQAPERAARARWE